MLKNARRDALCRSAVVLLSVMIILRDLFTNLVYLRPVPALHSYIWELLIVGQLWTLCLRRKEKTKMEWLLLCYVGWAVLTRFLLRDFTETVSLEMLILGEMCVAFFAMHNLDRKTASRIFTIVTAIVCGVLTVWAICGLVVMLTDVQEIPLLNEVIRLTEKKSYLEFFPINRNETAAWFMFGLWLLAYQWVTCKQRLWRIPMGFSMVLMYIMIAMQRSLTVYLSTAATIGLMSASLLLKLKWKKVPQYLLMAAVAAACGFVVYKSFFAINSAFSSFFKVTSIGSYLQDRKSVVARGKIWKGELYALLHHPRLLLFGQPESEISLNLSRYGGLSRTYGHTHNGFMQVLAMYGLPGLLLLCGFLLVLAWKVIQAYFAENASSARILALLLIGLVIDSLMEPVLTAWMGLSTSIFMLAAGWLTRENAEEASNGQA